MDQILPGGLRRQRVRIRQAATARCEVRGEVGLDVALTDVHHHEIATCEGYEYRLHVLRVFFHDEYEEGSIAIQPGEVNGTAWFARSPAEERLFPGT